MGSARIRLFRIGTRGRASQTTQIKISAWPSIIPHQRMEVGSTGIAVTNTESFVKYHFYKLILPKRNVLGNKYNNALLIIITIQ